MFWHKATCQTCGLIVDTRHKSVKRVQCYSPWLEAKYDLYYCGNHTPIFDEMEENWRANWDEQPYRYFKRVELFCGKK